ncbi:MAG TPA: response regulator transcription factor [Thermodesulfobacteriota bacterium]|nr:response regulator transcription factor [Deltaproteobacteria bacterium]HNR12037.1 response regulator transcription factor [Thermodesulfobacteriota bacterium]
MTNTKILIADDHRVVKEGIESLLASYPEFAVIGGALDGEDALEKIKSLRPDIVIMDIEMPKLNGIDVTKEIRNFDPDIRIIIYSMYSNKEYVIDLFKAGIAAYVLKEDPVSDLILAIKAVSGGGTYFSTKAPSIVSQHIQDLEKTKTDDDDLKKLSQREQQVLRLLAEGYPIKEIANQLYISPRTVESHKYNIMGKLQVSSMVDLVKIAIKKTLIKV